MLRSMYSGVSGLRTHQVMMDVVGNNIANINTAGYKSSSTQFQDVLSQTLQNANPPLESQGGTNPAQVGLGVKVASITTNFAQGNLQSTGKATDLAIQGDGLFAIRQGNETLYTRAGSFNFDANGFLVSPNGGRVQGWLAKEGDIGVAGGPLQDIVLPLGQTLPPKQTTEIRLGGNIPDAPYDATNPITVLTGVTAYDAQGTAIKVSIKFEQTGEDAWTVTATAPRADGSGTETIGTMPMTWDSTTKTFSASSMPLTPPPSVGVFSEAMSIQLGTTEDPMTQFAGGNTLAALEQNGSSVGSLTSFSVNPDGTILGLFSNGQTRPTGRIAMANFTNPSGLEKVGNSTYRPTLNSGLAQIGAALTGGRGSIAGGTVEMSNVDLAQEFTNLIVAQRGFQANSRVITSSDELLQDLVNLKR